MDGVKKIHSGTLYRNGPVDGAYGQQHSPVSRSDASTEDAELSAALAHQHHLAMQAGEYPVGGGVEAEYSQYVSSPAAHYNHMGHLTMAPSQKYPHVMEAVSVGSGYGVSGGASAGHYGTYAHYGAAYPAQPYLVDPQMPAYMTQEYVEGGGSASPRSASPGALPPQHNLHLQQRYDSSSLEQLGRHYCVTSPRGEYAADAYTYQHYQPAIDPQHHTAQPFKDSQNGLSLGSTGGQSLYGDEEELQKQMANMALVHGGVGREEGGGLQWRDPNLPEVIGFLNSPSDVVKANAAAYLQHLTYMDDPNKQKTRSLGGIPPLVRLVTHENPEVSRNACGALRNLSYGRQNDENKRAIRDAGGIPSLMALLCRTSDMEVKELVTGVIWNMSSCEDLKQSIIDDAAQVIFNKVIILHSGWHPTNPGETYWSTIFRNASGTLRNASSAGEYARRRLRSLPGLAEALLHTVRTALNVNAIGTKVVENCVCVLRNLSYRCQEIEDPLYDTRAPPTQSTGQARIQASASKVCFILGENLGCFGGSKKKKEGSSSNSTSPLGKNDADSQPLETGNSLGYTVPKGTEMLWSPEVVPLYMALLQTCSNPETLEAAAGALQNLAACYWQPSIDIRAAVRKEKGLPILVELLRMEVDRVVCAVATALRNLAIDQRNKELIGKYAMRDLVQKLPSGNQQHDQGTSDDTIAAVLATLNEVIKKSAEFSRSLLEAGGVERLLNLTKQRHRHTPRVLKFAGQVLMTMWSHAELREVYRKHGWREADFLTPARAAQPTRNSSTSGQGTPSSGTAGAPHSPSNANSTLSRPMASTGGTRYEDRTIRRHRENEDMPPMDANNYADGLGMGNPNGRPMNLQGVQAQMPPPSTR
ncbi:catenin delta-2 isoform X1 [Pieris brassicae]|uniref:catenin delta-2 isoform X1 n=1 Tax=Pieris brassicae TaxID=7116 RepID=UPI001E6610D9|nr:catenin delta-2 isoform X1 [Pieris brassicae]XP_045518911.1 catenin delta-2 isoform X1 [Pieris brassicae]